MKLFRCSSLHKLIGDGRSKAAVISDTAKSAIRDIVKEDLYGFRSFTGNQYTAKGNLLEDLAIEMSGKMRFRNYQKHVGRVENEQAAKAETELKAEEARQKNQAHRKKICGEALQGLLDLGVDEAKAKEILQAINKGKIPHVSLNF